MKVSKDITLRKFKTRDAKDFFEIAGNKEVNKSLTYPLHKNVGDTKFVIKNIFKKSKGPYSNLAIVLNKKVIGEISLFKKEQGYELGYQLNQQYWGKGIMTEVINSLLTEFFTTNPEDEVYVTAYKENKRSRALFKKFHFQKTDIKTYIYREEKIDDGTFMWKTNKTTWNNLKSKEKNSRMI